MNIYSIEFNGLSECVVGKTPEDAIQRLRKIYIEREPNDKTLLRDLTITNVAWMQSDVKRALLFFEED